MNLQSYILKLALVALIAIQSSMSFGSIAQSAQSDQEINKILTGSWRVTAWPGLDLEHLNDYNGTELTLDFNTSYNNYVVIQASLIQGDKLPKFPICIIYSDFKTDNGTLYISYFYYDVGNMELPLVDNNLLKSKITFIDSSNLILENGIKAEKISHLPNY